jgi:predicted GNAT family acetyltransferase
MRSVGTYVVDDDKQRVDVAALWDFLSTEAYWARWRTRDDVAKQLAQAWRVVGCYDEDGRMIGFARGVSDECAVAYLADVYVLDGHRGQGLAQAIVSEMIDNGPGRGFRWMLHTSTAGGLYRKFGFAAPGDTYMERPSARASP